MNVPLSNYHIVSLLDRGNIYSHLVVFQRIQRFFFDHFTVGSTVTNEDCNVYAAIFFFFFSKGCTPSFLSVVRRLRVHDTRWLSSNQVCPRPHCPRLCSEDQRVRNAIILRLLGEFSLGFVNHRNFLWKLLEILGDAWKPFKLRRFTFLIKESPIL